MALDNLPSRTYPAFGLSAIDRALKEHFAQRCKKEDLNKIRDYFTKDGPIECFYCGSISPNRWDHLFPVSKGGDTVPGNLVPACGSCDDSKQEKSFEEWLDSSSKKAPRADKKEIEKKIQRYRVNFPYAEPTDFQEKLTLSQKKAYKRIMAKVAEVRSCLIEEKISSK